VITQLVAAAALAAAPTPLLASTTVQDVAVAGPDVVVTRPGPGGSLRVDALPTAGGPARPLLTAAARGRGWDAFTAVAASPQRVAVVANYLRLSGASESRLYTGPATGPLTLAVRVRHDWDWAPADIAVDGDHVLVFETSATAARLRLFVPGAAPRVLPTPRSISGPVALAGDRAAFQSHDRLVVIDTTTGKRLGAGQANEALEFDVAADGRLVSDGNGGLFTFVPGGDNAPLPLPGSERLAEPRFAGTAVAAMERGRFGAQRPVVLDAGATVARPIGLPSLGLLELDADERGVAWLAHGCVIYAPVTAVAPREPPAGPCPRVEAFAQEASTTMRGRTLRLVATCVAAPATGCTGTVELRRHGVVGRGAFHVDAGDERRFSVRVSRRAARFVRRHTHGEDSVVLGMTIRVTDGGPPDRDLGVFIDSVR
jgi:hypothetical protein